MKTIICMAIFTSLFNVSNVEVDNIKCSEKIELSNYHNENDIYSTKRINGEKQEPLKAREMSYKGVRYFILSDLQGSIYATLEPLESGENYIGFTQSKKINGNNIAILKRVEKSDFNFTYEKDFNDKELIELENEIGERIIQELLTISFI